MRKSDGVRVHHERKNHHTDAYAQEGDIRYQQTEVFFMVVKNVDSLMTCGAVLAQMLKGEKHFAKQYHSTLGFPINHIVPISICHINF